MFRDSSVSRGFGVPGARGDPGGPACHVQLLLKKFATPARDSLVNRIDARGRLQVVCDAHRSQGRNVQAALEQMEALLVEALKRPKKRRKTKPTRASKERRLEGKKHRSKIKKLRARVND